VKHVKKLGLFIMELHQFVSKMLHEYNRIQVNKTEKKYCRVVPGKEKYAAPAPT
jgi:hypothetical protein